MAKIIIGGKERELKLGTLALTEIEEDLGISFISSGGQIFGDLKLRTLVSLVWGGLLHAEPSLKKSTVAGWFDKIMAEGDLASVGEAIQEMMSESPIFSTSVEKKIAGKNSKRS